MRDMLLKVAALPVDGDKPIPVSAWFRAFGPLLAPFLILACDLRSEMFCVAAVWCVLMIPGLLAANLLFPVNHPLGRGVSRLGVASILAMFPFVIPAWTACMLHWTLSTMLVVYVILYIASVAGLAHFLAHRRGASEYKKESWPAFELHLDYPRWVAIVVIVAVIVIMAGVVLSSPPIGKGWYDPASRPGWWYGLAIGTAASVIGALAILFGISKGSKPAEVSPALTANPRDSKPLINKQGKRKLKDKKNLRNQAFDWTPFCVALFWIAAGYLTVYAMKVSYSAWYPDMNAGTLVWNVDDVAYVSEAVDYRYGHPMGLYEPSLGSDARLRRAGMSPLTAPLVATIARITGVSCAALHHSVMPPLMILVGMSCMSAALMVVFRMHRWIVPLGMLIVLMMIFKSWDYARCMVEMLVFRAMQTKAQHLLLIYPLQLATLLLVLRRGNTRHLIAAIVVAVVGHGIHPFSSVMGVVWSTTLVGGALIGRRGAFIKMLLLLAVYLGLGGEFYLSNKLLVDSDATRIKSGRKAGSRIQSRDMIRVDTLKFSLGPEFRQDLDSGEVSSGLSRVFKDNMIPLPTKTPVEYDEQEDCWIIGRENAGYRVQAADDKLDVYEIAGSPIMQHDPFWAFGCNTLFHMGSLAVPLVLAFGWKRREILCVGLLGAAVLVVCNNQQLGDLLNKMLPASIMWRARWMLPQLVNAAVIGAVLYWAFSVLLRGKDGSLASGKSFLVSLLVVAAFCSMLYNTTSRRLQIGDPPKQLDKFTVGSHGMVELLGGWEADPYVWGSFLVHHELPQLMPNVKLVFSRAKIMRASEENPQYRRLVNYVFEGFKEGTVEPRYFNALLNLYPIDHVVLDYALQRAKKPAEMLKALGWTRVGYSKPYEVWRAPHVVADETARPSS